MVCTVDFNRALDAFTSRHTLVGPCRACTDNEIAHVDAYLFTAAPIETECEFTTSAPIVDDPAREKKYLWVIRERIVPFAKEISTGGIIKHSNLTGGGQAYCGGEVWFADRASIYLNGGSGRYPCEDNEQLLSEVKDFYMTLGYQVALPPFNEDSGQRPRVFKSQEMVVWESHD